MYFFLSSPYSMNLFQGTKLRDMNLEGKIGLPQSKCIKGKKINFCSFCCDSNDLAGTDQRWVSIDGSTYYKQSGT